MPSEDDQLTDSTPMALSREEIAILETAGRILGMLASSRGCERAGLTGSATGTVRYNAFPNQHMPKMGGTITGGPNAVFADSIPELIAKL